MNALELRNYLYRLKVKMLYKSGPLAKLRNSIWMKAGVREGVHVCFQNSYKCLSGFDLGYVTDSRLIERYEWENKTYDYQSDLIYRVDNPVYLEPKNSLGIMKDRFFVEETRSCADKYLLPSFKDIVTLQSGVDHSHLKKAFLFDGYASRNHYHFFEDCLNPLMMMLESGIVDKTIEIIYNHKIENLKWFKFYRELPEFSNLNWRRQEQGEWILVDELYRAFSTKRWWRALASIADSHVVKSPKKNIFIERKPFHARTFSNQTEIHKILNEYNFDIVFLDDMTYENQMQLFAESRNIVAHHGAGLANLVYTSSADVGLLEIFSAGLVQPHYYWLAKELDVDYYDAIIGSGFDSSYRYYLNPDVFRKQLSKMLYR